MALTKVTDKQVTYKQGAVGSVVRNLGDKLRECVSVKDFGAVGDGVTDDTEAIQAAINYCQDNIKALYFPSNNVSQVYRITSTLVVSKPLVIIGEGSRNVTIGGALSAGAYALDIDGTAYGTYENAEIRGLTLMPGAGAHCMRIKDVSNSIFSDIGLRNCTDGIVYTGTRCFSNLFEKLITITGMSGSAIKMDAHTGGGQHSFRECSLGGDTGFSLTSTTATDSIAFYNTNFEQCTTNSVYIGGSVCGLSFFGCRTEGCDGIDFLINPDPGKYVRGLTVQGCFFSSSDNGAANRIQLGGAGGTVRGFDISGNHVQHSIGGFSGNLVNLNGDGESGTVANNFLEGNIGSCAPVNVRRHNVLVYNNEGADGKFASNSLVQDQGAWVPIDASGAGLTLGGSGGR